MDYAIIRTGGKQYRVSPGDILDVEKVDGVPGSTFELKDVLLVSQNGSVTVGSPTVENVKVVSEIQEHGRGKKLVVFRYKSKTRQGTKTGHRQSLTRLSVKDILSVELPSKRNSKSAQSTKETNDGA